MKGSIKNTLLAFAIAVFSSAYLTAAIAGGSSDGNAVETIVAAKAALKKADSVGGAWRDTAKMIKKAEKLLTDGDTEAAIKQAKKAKDQGMLGYDQAVTQSSGKLHI